MLSSQSDCSIESPIGTVPYDVLLEIFVNCLPHDRLEFLQPDTRIAPILLCHICSSWRTIALASPILWSHMSFRFIIHDIYVSWAFLQSKIEFLRWWKKNHGAMAPFLRLYLQSDIKTEMVTADETAFAFVTSYMATAQHLEIHPFFWHRVPDMIDKIGGHNLTFGNLHSLVIYEHPPSAHQSYYFHHTFSRLRRLAIVGNTTWLYGWDAIPAQWASLTHLSIGTYFISLDYWVPLTSAVPRLQWAYIHFNRYEGRLDAHRIKRTLPELSTLLIASGDPDDCSISPFFMDLHLPALDTLFLSSAVKEWWEHRGIPDVNTLLQSAPALRNLTLRKQHHLSLAELVYATATLPAGGYIAPVWSCVPHLAHLQLELLIAGDQGESEAANELDSFAHSAFFSDNRWLDLNNPACPINTITVIDHGLISPDHQSESDTYRKMKTPIIQKSAGNASNIALHLRSEPFIDFADSWKKWRSGM